MTAVVTKSSPVAVVGPWVPGMPTGSGIINLSSLDKCFASIPVTLLLVFDQPIGETVKTIKKALSRALVHYQPMAGRLAVGAEDGELHIACTGEGVSFVGASASCALDDGVTTSALLLKDLVVGYPGDYCLVSDPLVLMQVTEFSCGGFVVGVTWNHVVADGAGMAQFLQAVGELARGMPAPSVVPARSDIDVSLPRLPPSMVAELRSQMRIETEEMASLDVTVPLSLISRIKAQCSGGDCTVFDAIAAVLWRCRTRAIISDDHPDAPTPLLFASSMRRLVGAKHGYYGNCVTTQMVQASSASAANSDISDLVKLIKLAKGKVPDLFKGDGDGAGIGGGGDQQRQAPTKYNTLLVTSWRNLGFDEADFGRGTPARVMWRADRTVGLTCILCPPCKRKDGVNVLSLCVKPEHADAFRRELAALDIM